MVCRVCVLVGGVEETLLPFYKQTLRIECAGLATLEAKLEYL